MAARCSPRVPSLLGYNIHSPFIGQVDGMHPMRLIDPGYPSQGREQKTEAAEIADQYLARPSHTREPRS